MLSENNVDKRICDIMCEKLTICFTVRFFQMFQSFFFFKVNYLTADKPGSG